MHTISLAPDGSLRLGLPSGRTLDFAPIPEALLLIQRILLNAGSPNASYVEQNPTQHHIDEWLKALSRVIPAPDEPTPSVRRKPKPSHKSATRAAMQTAGLDLSLVEFTL